MVVYFTGILSPNPYYGFFAHPPEKVYFSGYWKHLYGRKLGERKVSGKEKCEITLIKINFMESIGGGTLNPKIFVDPIFENCYNIDVVVANSVVRIHNLKTLITRGNRIPFGH